MNGTSEQALRCRPRVKVCGLTTVEDALFAVRCGAELIGLNFYPPSPRFVEAPLAAEIAAAVRAERTGTLVVAVVVNASDDEIRALDQAVDLDLIQFHGDESDDQVAAWGERAVRALRLGAETTSEDLEATSDLFGVLIDAPHRELYGGTGESWDFARVESLADPARRLLLAGGLDPDNAVAAAEAVPSAWALDLCSGVESQPGIKDEGKVTALFERLDEAFPDPRIEPDEDADGRTRAFVGTRNR